VGIGFTRDGGESTGGGGGGTAGKVFFLLFSGGTKMDMYIHQTGADNQAVCGEYFGGILRKVRANGSNAAFFNEHIAWLIQVELRVNQPAAAEEDDLLSFVVYSCHFVLGSFNQGQLPDCGNSPYLIFRFEWMRVSMPQ
jgi:hypothetical protein